MLSPASILPMNLSKYFSLSICSFVLAGRCLAADVTPVLDLKAVPSDDLKVVIGKNIDLDIDAGKVESTPEGLSIKDGRAVTILHDPKSPVFGKGSFTWIVKCRIADPFAPSRSPILLGRWEVGHWKEPLDQRVVAIGLVPEKGELNFMLSPNGTADACVGAQMPPVTAGAWIQVVFRVEVGRFMAFSIYDDQGDILAEEKIRELEMKGLFDAPADLVLGAGPEAGVTLSRVRIWDKALSPDQVEKAVSEK